MYAYKCILGSKNALGFSAYTGPKIVIGLRPWYKFDKRSDTGSNIENIIPVILGMHHRYESYRSFLTGFVQAPAAKN